MPNLGPKFWEDEKRRMLAILLPRIGAASLGGVKAAARKVGIGLSFELANQEAAKWAREYIDQLLEQLGTTSERLVGEALAQWIEQPGSNMGDLVDMLAPKFGGNVARADLIAVTETTRAYANGEKQAYLSSGIEHWRWNTNRDEKVCPLCRPLNGKVVRIGEPFGHFEGKSFTEPPAHPGCYCWVSPAVGSRAQSQERGLWGGFRAETQSAIRVNLLSALHSLSDRQAVVSIPSIGYPNGIRISGERRAHWQIGHPETIGQEEILLNILQMASEIRTDPRDLTIKRYYWLDQKGKWWRAAVKVLSGEQPFVLSFHRVRKPGS